VVPRPYPAAKAAHQTSFCNKGVGVGHELDRTLAWRTSHGQCDTYRTEWEGFGPPTTKRGVVFPPVTTRGVVVESSRQRGRQLTSGSEDGERKTRRAR
jgi:hypothetical protein